MGTAPILVNYRTEGADWTVDVKADGTVLTEQAPGLIAARDRADQMVEKLTGGEQDRKPTVVHLLDGDAFAFTTAYLHARHGLTAKPVADTPTVGVDTQEMDLSELADDPDEPGISDHPTG